MAHIENSVVPAGATGRIEQERRLENPLWELLPTLRSFSPEDRAAVDQYVRESIQDIGVIRVMKKLINGSPSDYSVFVAQSIEDRPDIVGDNAVELAFSKDGCIRDAALRPSQIFLTALVQKDSPLLKLADPRHPHSNLLDTVVRVAAIYLDDPPDEYRSIASLLDNPEFDGIAFGINNLKQTAPAPDNYSFKRSMDARRWQRSEEGDFDKYLSQPATRGGEERWKVYGKVFGDPGFQVYRSALLGPVELKKAQAQEEATKERALQEEKQRRSKEVLDRLAVAVQELATFVKDSAIAGKTGGKVHAGARKGRELLEVTFDDPNAKVRAEVFDWQPSGAGDEMLKGRLKHMVEIFSDAKAAKNNIAARVQIHIPTEGGKQERVIMIPLRENTRTKALLPIVGGYEGARIDGSVLDTKSRSIGGQSHESFQEMIQEVSKKVADTLAYLKRL